MALDRSNFPHSGLLEALRERGHEDSDIECMSSSTMFEEYCEWHGIIGWAGALESVLDAARAFKEKPATSKETSS